MSVEEAQQIESGNCVNLEAVNRITKLPIVESTIETATNIYTKVKDYNTVTNWTFSTAENTAHKAVEIAKPYATPIVTQLKDPIQKVDGLLCTGLDYVEEKIPAVKLPPGEMYTGAKGIVTNTVGTGVETAKNTVEAAKHMVEPAVESVKHKVEAGYQMVGPAVESVRNKVEAGYHMVEPAVESVKNKVEAGYHMVEPAIETAKHYVEPAVETAKHYIDPAMETACAIKDYSIQQVDKLLHSDPEKETLECEECQNQKEESKDKKKEENVDY